MAQEYVLKGESRLVIYKTKYRNKTYDKCLINIPASIFKDERFPFKNEEKLSITIHPDEKVIILSPFGWEEFKKALEVIQRHKSGDVLKAEEVQVINDYCAKVGCESCELKKRFGKCPIVVSVP